MSGGHLCRRGRNRVIEDNEIFENEFAGIAVWRAAATIRDNEIYDCKGGTYIGDRGGGIIDKNRLHHNRGPGIKTAGGEPTILSNTELGTAQGDKSYHTYAASTRGGPLFSPTILVDSTI